MDLGFLSCLLDCLVETCPFLCRRSSKQTSTVIETDCLVADYQREGRFPSRFLPALLRIVQSRAENRYLGLERAESESEMVSAIHPLNADASEWSMAMEERGRVLVIRAKGRGRSDLTEHLLLCSHYHSRIDSHRPRMLMVQLRPTAVCDPQTSLILIRPLLKTEGKGCLFGQGMMPSRRE